MKGVFGAVLGVEELLGLCEKMAENYEKKARVLSYNRIYIPRFKSRWKPCISYVSPLLMRHLEGSFWGENDLLKLS